MLMQLPINKVIKLMEDKIKSLSHYPFEASKWRKKLSVIKKFEHESLAVHVSVEDLENLTDENSVT